MLLRNHGTLTVGRSVAEAFECIFLSGHARCRFGRWRSAAPRAQPRQP
jgi:hypothetical protein